jgi:uncharacterized protein YqeY
MSMQESISAELKSAIKKRDTARTGAIRILIGEFQRQPEKDLTDQQVTALIKKLVKAEQELLAFSKEATSDFIRILESYLPKQVSDDEIREWIRGNIDFSVFNNRMQTMRPIMTHFGSSTDGNVVKKILMEFGE